MAAAGPIGASAVEPGPHGSDTITAIDGGRVRVVVRPEYLEERSDPAQPLHVFGYHIAVRYEAQAGAPAVQLLDRRWVIIDAHGGEEVVEGAGVVGQQPTLEPGESFEYASYCPLRTRWGTMEGSYTFAIAGGQRRPVRVGRFYLVAHEASDQ